MIAVTEGGGDDLGFLSCGPDGHVERLPASGLRVGGEEGDRVVSVSAGASHSVAIVEGKLK